MTSEEIWTGVRASVVEALGVDADEVTPNATIMDELGAESIDLLDILFRVERKTGVKIKAADLSAYIQGDIPEGEFDDENDVVTLVALAQLKAVMPQVDIEQLAGTLQAKDVIKLFSVQNLADLVASRAASPAAA